MTGVLANALRRRLTLLAGLIALSSTAEAAPDWVNAAAALPTPGNVGAAAAVVLLDQTAIEVDATGLAVTTHRLAIRILSGNGGGWAQASVGYLQRHDDVRRLNAWLMRNGTAITRPDSSAWVDLAADASSTLYSDFRLKQMDRGRDAASGDVFAAETVVAGPMLIAATGYGWGWTLPVVTERFQLSVPAGFTVTPVLHGDTSALVANVANGRVFSWEMLNQPYVRSEPGSPSSDPAKPVLFATITPPAKTASFRPAVLRSWIDVAAWIGTLNQGQCDSSPRLTEMVRTLIPPGTDQLGTMRALSRYVQRLRYVARNDRIGQGYGYKAHKASEVFAAGYGDCKDKANLLVAMLREAGITAFLAAARLGDDREVWPDAASPNQFDHAIVAIQVDDTVDLPAVVPTEKWGRVLFFDATDPFTLLGDLPAGLQGTRVFPQHPDSAALIELPRIEPAKGHVQQRRAALQLSSDGVCSVRISVIGRGQAGARERARLFRNTTAAKLHERATELLVDSLRTAALREIAPHDDETTGDSGISFSFLKPGFLQFLPGGMAVAPLTLFSAADVPVLSLAERRSPVKWPALAYDDQIELKLPGNFALEESPAALSFVSPFGTYRRTVTFVDDVLTLRRQVTLTPQIVAPADYAALKKFAADLAKADRASLLLRRHN